MRGQHNEPGERRHHDPQLPRQVLGQHKSREPPVPLVHPRQPGQQDPALLRDLWGRGRSKRWVGVRVESIECVNRLICQNATLTSFLMHVNIMLIHEGCEEMLANIAFPLLGTPEFSLWKKGSWYVSDICPMGLPITSYSCHLWAKYKSIASL